VKGKNPDPDYPAFFRRSESKGRKASKKKSRLNIYPSLRRERRVTMRTRGGSIGGGSAVQKGISNGGKKGCPIRWKEEKEHLKKEGPRKRETRENV